MNVQPLTTTIMKVFYGIMAVATLSAGLMAAEFDDILFCVSMIALSAICLQKAGVVNWADEIRKEE